MTDEEAQALTPAQVFEDLEKLKPANTAAVAQTVSPDGGEIKELRRYRQFLELSTYFSETGEPGLMEMGENLSQKITELKELMESGVGNDQLRDFIAGKHYANLFATLNGFEGSRALDKTIACEQVGGQERAAFRAHVVAMEHCTMRHPDEGPKIAVRNFDRATTRPCPHIWLGARIDNGTSGPWARKIAMLLEAESKAVDANYHRWRRADKDNVMGSMYMQFLQMTTRFASFFFETTCHFYARRALRRNLWNTNYGARLEVNLEDKQAWGLVRPEGYNQRSYLRCGHQVNEGDANVEGLPGVPGRVDARILVVPRDGLVEWMGAGVADVFVSRACTKRMLFDDIHALYAASRNDFREVCGQISMVCVHLSTRDLEACFGEVGLAFDAAVEPWLADLSHWLTREDRKYCGADFTCLEGDVLRLRDLLTYSTFSYQRSDGCVGVLTDVGNGQQTLTLPLSTWKERVCLALNILAPKRERWVSIPDWRALESNVYWRGVAIGYYTDVAARITCGSGANIEAHLGGSSKVVEALRLSTLWSINDAVTPSGEPVFLGFRWEVRVGIGANAAERVDGLHTANNIPPPLADASFRGRDPVTDGHELEGDASWWIQHRAAWPASWTPTLPDLGATAPAALSQVGPNCGRTSDWTPAVAATVLGCIQAMGREVTYTIIPPWGKLKHLVLRFTGGQTAGPTLLEWHTTVDKHIRGHLGLNAGHLMACPSPLAVFHGSTSQMTSVFGRLCFN